MTLKRPKKVLVVPVRLTPEQGRTLKRLANKEKISASEMLRKLVEKAGRLEEFKQRPRGELISGLRAMANKLERTLDK